MAQEYNARIKLKRDTSTNWTTNNPVLLNGEVVLVDTAAGELRAKIGDGTKTYTQLPFADELLESLLDIPALISEHNSASDAHLDIRTLINNLEAEVDDKADTSALSDFYTKSEIDNYELITTDEIDTICGGSVQYAEDVMF